MSADRGNCRRPERPPLSLLLFLLLVPLLAWAGNAWRSGPDQGSTDTELTTASAGEDVRAPGLAADEYLPGNPVQVEVTGREYAWHYRFAGPDAEFGTSDDVPVQGDLHLPQGADVEFLLRSDDFVYIFKIPDLGLREISVPELTFTLRFHTEDSGTLDVLADPLCSVRLFHDDVMGRVVIEPRAVFDAWFHRCRQTSPP